MKRFVFLSGLFFFTAVFSHAQMVKPTKVQVEKKSTQVTAVGKNERVQTQKAKLPVKRATKTVITMQASSYKKRIR